MERQIALLSEQVQRLSAQLDKAQAQHDESRNELREVMTQHQQQALRHATELERLQTSHQEEMGRFAQTHAAELARLQAVHQEENSALRAEVSRQAGIFECTTNHLMMETSRVRDAAKQETERMTRHLAHSRKLVDQLRVHRSNAARKAPGLRAPVESAALQLRQLQKAHDRLQAQQAATRVPGGESEEQRGLLGSAGGA